VSNFGPDISTSSNPVDKTIVTGVAQYGPYGSFGVPTYVATDVVMKAIASVCKAGQTPSRSNVLAAIRQTNIPAAANPMGVPITFQSNGNLAGASFYLFHIDPTGKYISIANH
jgi:ABC-type branched-subunit amino acid transport system substrate-binding protein